MQWKDYKLFEALQFVFGSQLHGRHLRTWRFERPLVKYFKLIVEQIRGKPLEHWYELAANRVLWDRYCDSFAEWRAVNHCH